MILFTALKNVVKKCFTEHKKYITVKKYIYYSFNKSVILWSPLKWIGHSDQKGVNVQYQLKYLSIQILFCF